MYDFGAMLARIKFFFAAPFMAEDKAKKFHHVVLRPSPAAVVCTPIRQPIVRKVVIRRADNGGFGVVAHLPATV